MARAGGERQKRRKTRKKAGVIGDGKKRGRRKKNYMRP
jgi:hypothetical protein